MSRPVYRDASARAVFPFASKFAVSIFVMDYFQLERTGDLTNASLFYFEDPFNAIRHMSNLWVGSSVTKYMPKHPVLVSQRRGATKLSGFIGGDCGGLVVSTKARAVIEKLCPKQKIEYFTCALHSKEGEVLSSDYCIINPLGGFDALDEKYSKVNRADDGKILSIETAVLDPKKVETAPHLFRLKQESTTLIVSSKLVDALVEAGIGNLFLRPLSQPPVHRPSGPIAVYSAVDKAGDRKTKKWLWLECREGDQLFASKKIGGTTLPDIIGNDLGAWVVAKRVTKLLGDLEYRDVTIVDRAGNLVAGYVTVHPHPLDAFAGPASVVFYESEGTVRSNLRPVLDPAKLKGAPPVFSLTHVAGTILVSDAIVKKLAKLTNFVATPLHG